MAVFGLMPYLFSDDIFEYNSQILYRWINEKKWHSNITDMVFKYFMAWKYLWIIKHKSCPFDDFFSLTAPQVLKLQH